MQQTVSQHFAEFAKDAKTPVAAQLVPGGAAARFFSEIGHLSLDELQQIGRAGGGIHRENSLQFLLNNEQKNHLSGRIDPVPALLDSQQWDRLSAGLAQRARLLNALLADLYGPRTVITKAILPQAVVLRSQTFLRPCVRMEGEAPPPLVFMSTEIARTSLGYTVVRDTAAIPYGLGHILEGRTTLATLYPGVMVNLDVERLADAFLCLRAGLDRLSPRVEDRSPRIVVLHPGPHNPSHYEFSYLASYLGYTLAQGADLMVRDGRVWLKALEGLQPVDVVVRDVRDAWVDPLELDERSMLGVPGLLEAARRQTVSLANPVGAGLLENPALFPFLASICRLLLDEDLLLPTLATWWCGQRREREYVLAHLDTLQLKTIDGSALPPRDRLREAVREEGWRFVAQEHIVSESVPCLGETGLEWAPCTLRMFTFHDGDTYQVMPGGSARQAGGEEGAKDLWILADEPRPPFQSLWTQHAAGGRQTAVAGLFTSRSAENLHWAGRYMERAASLAQTLRTVLRDHADSGFVGAPDEPFCHPAIWQGLLEQAGLAEQNPPAMNREVALALVFEAEARGGILPAIRAFVRNASSVRENWSLDTWRIIKRLDAEAAMARPGQSPEEHLGNLILLLLALAGQCNESMTRTPGWGFMDLGRYLERGIMLIDLVRGTLSHSVKADESFSVLERVLELNDNLITYRRAYRTSPEIATVMHLLIADQQNPRGLSAILLRVEESLKRLVKQTGQSHVHADLRPLLEQLESMCLSEWSDKPDSYLEVLEPFSRVLLEIGRDLDQLYFKHVKFRRQAVGPHRPVVPSSSAPS